MHSKTAAALPALLLAAADAAASGLQLRSVEWTQQPGTIPITQLGGSWSLGGVTGTTGAMQVDNAGFVFSQNWGSYGFANGFDTTSDATVAIGAAANTVATQSFSFSAAVSQLHLFFNYTDANMVVDFGPLAWTLLGATNASRSGSAVVIAGAAGSNGTAQQGFLVRIDGEFGPGEGLAFDISNSSPWQSTVGFTIATPVPEPSTYGLALGGLALVGAAMARRRRRR